MSTGEMPASPVLEAAEPSDYDAAASEVTDSLPEDSDVNEIAEDTQEEAIDAAVASGEISKKEAQILKKTLKIKVDGEESDMEIDFNNEDELKRHLQKSKAFDKRVKEFSGYKSQVEQMLQMLQEDPETLLERMGIDVDSLSEKRLSKRVEELKKTPEQIEREKMNKELEDLRKEKKAAEEAKQKAEQEKLRNEEAAKIENDIAEALESTGSVLPRKSPWVLRNVAQAMYLAATNGYPEVTAKDVMPIVERQFQEELNELFSVAPQEVLEKLVGKGNLDKYRQSRVQKKVATATTTAKQVAKDTGAKKVVKEEAPAAPKKFKDVFDFRK